jgi:hypothetical protein
VLVHAKSDLDKARSAAAKLALWLMAALLAGALASSLAAIEGGRCATVSLSRRDDTSKDETMGPILLWLLGIPIPIIILLMLFMH